MRPSDEDVRRGAFPGRVDEATAGGPPRLTSSSDGRTNTNPK